LIEKENSEEVACKRSDVSVPRWRGWKSFIRGAIVKTDNILNKLAKYQEEKAERRRAAGEAE
jgi:hypothetical protein